MMTPLSDVMCCKQAIRKVIKQAMTKLAAGRIADIIGENTPAETDYAR